MFNFDLNHLFQRVLVLRSFICWNISFSKYQTKNTSVYIFKLILRKWLDIFVQTWFEPSVSRILLFQGRLFVYSSNFVNVKLEVLQSTVLKWSCKWCEIVNMSNKRLQNFRFTSKNLYNEGPFICWNVEFGEYRTSSIGIDIFEMVTWLMPICYYFE